MAQAFIDTNVFFASVSARDQYHDSAHQIVRAIDHGTLPTAVVTNYVVAETLNLVREKMGPETATTILDNLVEGMHFEIRHASESDFTSAQAVFRRYDELSFVDATIVAGMRRADTQYLYSFDDDFDAVEDITRLDSAVNPFS